MLSHAELSQINQKIKANKIFVQEETDKLSKDIWDHKDTLNLVRQQNDRNSKKINISFGVLMFMILFLKLK